MSKDLSGENLNTAYDDAYHTLLNDCPQLIIPVVNEIFHENYTSDEAVRRTNENYYINRPEGEQLQRVADSNVRIRDRTYHLECQSTVDGSMIMRIFEYDAQAALQDAEMSGNVLTVNFPHAAVLYLRHNRNTPEHMVIRVKVPRAECSYEVPVIKTQLYSVEELFEKKLYFLIPFHIFVYEKRFDEYDGDAEKLEKLQKSYVDIVRRLDECARSGLITEYTKKTIMAMGQRVLEKIAIKHRNVREGIGEIMGGKVLDYEAKDILNEGIRQGCIQGEEREKIQIAERMLQRNMSVEEIAVCTELTVEQVQELKCK